MLRFGRGHAIVTSLDLGGRTMDPNRDQIYRDHSSPSVDRPADGTGDLDGNHHDPDRDQDVGADAVRPADEDEVALVSVDAALDREDVAPASADVAPALEVPASADEALASEDAVAPVSEAEAAEALAVVAEVWAVLVSEVVDAEALVSEVLDAEVLDAEVPDPGDLQLVPAEVVVSLLDLIQREMHLALSD